MYTYHQATAEKIVFSRISGLFCSDVLIFLSVTVNIAQKHDSTLQKDDIRIVCGRVLIYLHITLHGRSVMIKSLQHWQCITHTAA